MNRLSLAAFVIALQLGSGAYAADYIETIDGDLSDVPASPTPWALTVGANQLAGSAGTSLGNTDYDLVAFTVPANHRLDSITVSNVLDETSAFFGLQDGSPWQDGLGWEITGSYLIGWAHIGYGQFPPELLAELGVSAPLDSGVYTMIMQDVDTPFDYAMTFNVSALPEPASAGMAAVACALAGVTGARRRRRAHAAV